MATKKKVKFDRAFPYFMCLPAVILFTGIMVVAFIQGIVTSLFSWDGLGDMKWIGLKNYYFTVTDPIFWVSIKNTMLYAFFVTVMKNILGLLLAFLLMKELFGRTLFRTATYMPVTFSYVVVGILWSWIFNPTFGILNAFLNAVGLGGWIQGWLSDPNIAMFSVMWVDIWKWVGFHMVLYLAGLQGIPKDLYEAASIDGANAPQRFIHITIPQLNSTLIVNVLLSVTGAFTSNYDVVKVMTGGGPFHSTEVALTYITDTAFKFSAVGKANAMSVVLFLFVFVFGFIQLKVMTRDENYE